MSRKLYAGVMAAGVAIVVWAVLSMPAPTRVVQGAQGEIAVVCADTVTTEDGVPAWGEADYQARTIRVECDLRKNFNMQVVTHERCHFALTDTHTYIEEFVDDSASASVLEERICDAMGMGLR